MDMQEIFISEKLAVEANAENMSKLNNKKDANQYKKMLKNKLLKKWQKDKRNNAKIKVKAGEMVKSLEE